jgi:NAD(P)-dependent dehydrogenase (short-subunit alcohol dehydrogenase family)
VGDSGAHPNTEPFGRTFKAAEHRRKCEFGRTSGSRDGQRRGDEGIGRVEGKVAFVTGARGVWKETIDINFTGVWNTVHLAAPHVVAGGRGGSIVLTSSTAGLKGQPFLSAYVAAKRGPVEPVDVSNAVLFLASDEARYVTAPTMTVDAGNTQY